MRTATLKAEAMHKENFLLRFFNKQVQAFEEERFGRMIIFLTAQSCLGSIACMFGLKADAGDWALITAAAVTMWSNSMFISQASAKWSMLVFFISILVNTALIIAYV